MATTKSPEEPSFRFPEDAAAAVFPTEFPYEEFDSTDVGSTETESNISSDEEDFLAGLTRRLAQSSLSQTHKLSVPSFAEDKNPEWVMSGSPQSTLSGLGSWSSNGSPTAPSSQVPSPPTTPSSQVPSPPTTPFGALNDTWDLIYAAAGQVARLKMADDGAKYSNYNNGRGVLGPPRTPSPSSLPCVPNQSHFTQIQSQGCGGACGNPKIVKLNWSAQQQQQIQSRCGVGHHHGLSLQQVHNAWPPLQSQHQNRNTRPVLPNGPTIKRESAGTGVFLPRRYSNPTPPAPEPPRKRAGCPTVLLPAKVVQALNLSFGDMNAHHYHQHQVQQQFNNAALAPNHEALVARRNALLAQQRRGFRPSSQEGPLNCEVRLPQEWTY